MKQPHTLQEAIVYFSDPERAFVYAVNLRWPDKHVTCPRCGHDKHYFIKTRCLWLCKGCKKQFTVKVGSIFEDSALGLDKWMTAVWMLVNSKNGVSSHEMARTLGITQKSAWFMLQRIRLALKKDGKVGGSGNEVECDETFIGGKMRNMHRDKKIRYIRRGGHSGNKTVVFGALDRDARQIRAQVIPDIRRDTLQAEVLNSIHHGSKIYTDAFSGYDKVKADYVHEVVNHAERYVSGRVHTNGLENFWSLLKRGLTGTYVAVEPFHLERYVDEQVFRYNTRKDLNDAGRFELAMGQVANKRLTYEQLTGKSDSPRTQ
ncbi:MAG: IS1595 family transposase [Acidobacteriota bacterium]|nr:IS1595 family transposase [Acidobacteriota bacterium]